MKLFKEFKIISMFSIAQICGLNVFSGDIKNLTPEAYQQNPSNAYLIKMQSPVKYASVVPNSLRAKIIIDGNARNMVEMSKKDNTFGYDYIMPSDRNIAKYYFEINYDRKFFGKTKNYTIVSDLYTLNLANRFVCELPVKRGPIGSKIEILGRNFTNKDIVFVGNAKAKTELIASNTLVFQVPDIIPNQSYMVSISNGVNLMNVGMFLVDITGIHSDKSEIVLRTGEQIVLTLQINLKAPAGGLPISVTTNIPNSVVMPEITIPENNNVVKVEIEGGEEGVGYLYISAKGFAETIIPITVNKNISKVVQ